MQCAAPGSQPEGRAMETETAGWKWVVQGVVEGVLAVVALGLFGSLTLTLIG
jgi:hypothetical protein